LDDPTSILGSGDENPQTWGFCNPTSVGVAKDIPKSVLPVPKTAVSLMGSGGTGMAGSEAQAGFYYQGRRRHEPRSSGFLLEMRTELLFEWARRNGYALWVDLAVERTADKYKPESEMNWVKRREVFALH
jgi:hypothetical protein